MGKPESFDETPLPTYYRNEPMRPGCGNGKSSAPSEPAGMRLPSRSASSNFQVRRPDTALFATVEGLHLQSGVSIHDLRKLALKELVDNALDAADAAERPGAEIEQLGLHRYRVQDRGDGIVGSPEYLADLFALARPMISGKFWRRPERGALGNGLRIVVGCVVASGGTIEVTTRGQRILLRPLKIGRTDIEEVTEVAHPTGTQIIITVGSVLPTYSDDLSWAKAAIEISRAAGQSYTRAPSPHWFDADHLAEMLTVLEPPETTVRQFVEQLDGCTGAKAGKIAAAFGKNRTCHSMTEPDAAELLVAMQAATRPVKARSLGAIGVEAYDTNEYDYECSLGSFDHGEHEPTAAIPYIVEAWVTVTSRTGSDVEIAVLANRSPIVADVSANRTYDKSIRLFGAGLMRKEINVKSLGNCNIIVHITSPFIPISSLGKRPNLSVFGEAICNAVRLAFNRSRKRLLPDPVEQKAVPPAWSANLAKISVAVVDIDQETPQIPLGTLRLRIETEAEATGMKLDDLTVLSPQLDPYRMDSERNHEIGKWFANQVARLVPDNQVIHLRGLHYRIVASGDVRRPDGQAYVNTDANWIWLQSRAAKAARWLRYVPFNRIRDERNDAPKMFVAEHEHQFDTAMGCFVKDGERIVLPALSDMFPILTWNGGRQHRQPYRIVLIGEKSSLGEVLEPIARNVQGELLLSTGECSDTHVAEITERAATDGRPLVILYFSDFDPSGYQQMPVSVSRKLQALCHLLFPDLRVQLHHVALTLEQVREHNLPSTPLKESESRAAHWRENFGHEQTEIDALAALRPEVLRQIAEEAIRPFYDPTLAERAAKVRVEWQKRATEWFERLPSYAEAVSMITEAHDDLTDAADVLRDVQTRAAMALQDTTDAPEPPTDTIEPLIAVTAPTALFTTADSFADASRKLIFRKRPIEPYEEIES